MISIHQKSNGSGDGRRTFLNICGLLTLLAGGLAALLGPLSSPQAAEGTPAASQTADLKVATIPVEGMVCISCAASVKQTVKALGGVSAVEVLLTKGSVQVTYAPSRLAPDRIVSAINALGYQAGTPLAAAP